MEPSKLQVTQNLVNYRSHRTRLIAGNKEQSNQEVKSTRVPAKLSHTEPTSPTIFFTALSGSRAVMAPPRLK